MTQKKAEAASVNALLAKAVRDEIDRQGIMGPPDLARRCGLDAQIIRRLIMGQSTNPSFEALVSILWGLRKNWEWLGNALAPAFNLKDPPKMELKRQANAYQRLLGTGVGRNGSGKPVRTTTPAKKPAAKVKPNKGNGKKKPAKKKPAKPAPAPQEAAQAA